VFWCASAFGVDNRKNFQIEMVGNKKTLPTLPGYGNITPSEAKLLNRQNGKCIFCGAQFRNEDIMEVHHRIKKKYGGKDKYKNLALIHRHCHDQLHGKK